jgi:hypothetical protein
MECQKPDRKGGRFQGTERTRYYPRERMGLTIKQHSGLSA